MTAPILLLVVLCLVAALVGGYVVWPLLRTPPREAVAEADAASTSRAVLRERRRELEAALAHLPAEAPERRAALAEFADQADAELARAGAVPGSDPPPAAPTRRPGAAAVLAAILVVPTFGLYLLAGAPGAAAPESRLAGREPASLDEWVADLRARLETAPKDLDAWRLLGRAELERGRVDEARIAFERAMALAPEDAGPMVDYADALAQSQGAVLTGRPIELVQRALAIDPRHPKALALAGAYEVGRSDYPAAIALWQRLLAVLPADSDQARQVEGFLADLRAGRPPQVGPREPAPTAGGPAPAEPAAAARSALRGRVELETRIAPKLDRQATVFVVARTLDADGRPAGPPVAVLRARGADLPLDFTLDDSHAMSPMARLSALPDGSRIVVLARVSRSGEATARPGDLQGASAPASPGTGGLRVLIDTVLD